ncbi:ankyrin and het domain protein [Colletotrichum sojae]|uniref:Ankyrin and het domain protein n=1 Tax=Colletotrichum sojae TaxID=2175907 RepID=A0A8H6N3P7_9PEZI|nr:ankyrin and het domain protein [Colletotrichum sojae]
MQSLMWGEAFLGRLGEGWKVRHVADNSAYEFTDPEGAITDKDPRMEELPPGWHEMIHPGGAPVWYKRENEETRECSWAWTDPRFDPDNLRARGVKIEKLTLV